MADGTTNRLIYALLVGVGNYEAMEMVNLPTYKTDLIMLREALISGLKAPEEHIRLQAGEGGNGTVSTTDLARAMAGFKSLLLEEDTFIFYYTGHGDGKNIFFSDGVLELQSLINYIDTLPAKNKIVILDCCFSGDFRTSGARKLAFGKTISGFAGHGIAVMASSAANETARLGPDGEHSIFTGALSTVITLRKGMRKGTLSLDDIFEQTRHLVDIWNRQNPDKKQHPVFRSSMGGTIYFPVENDQPYIQKEISYETPDYKVIQVKPLSTPEIKRLCAFVIPKTQEDATLSKLARYTKEIAEHIKNIDIYSDEKSEKIHKGKPARVIWCYFAHDKSDIINSLHYAYTIWAPDEEMRQIYYKPVKAAFKSDGVYIWKNNSYDILKQMQQPEKSREDIINIYRSLLALIITLSEQFITDLQEVANHTTTLETIREKYKSWIIKVKKI